jgi:hypothetical protein
MFTLSLEILFHPRSDLSTMRLKEHDQKSTRVLLQPSKGKLFGAAQVFSEEWFILSAAESFTMNDFIIKSVSEFKFLVLDSGLQLQFATSQCIKSHSIGQKYIGHFQLSIYGIGTYG